MVEDSKARVDKKGGQKPAKLNENGGEENGEKGNPTQSWRAQFIPFSLQERGSYIP